MDYEQMALTAINQRIEELARNNYKGRYWIMKNGWASKCAELNYNGTESTKDMAKKILQAGNKYLKTIWVDRLYYMAIRKPIIDKRLKELAK